MKNSLITIMFTLGFSSCMAKNSGEIIYSHLGVLIATEKTEFVEYTPSNELVYDPNNFITVSANYVEDYEEKFQSYQVPKQIESIIIHPHKDGSFTWKVLSKDFTFERHFEWQLLERYSLALEERIDNPTSHAVKGTKGIIKALLEIGIKQSEAEELISDAKEKFSKLTHEELLLKAGKVDPGLLKSEKDIEKAVDCAVLLLIKDASGPHPKQIIFFKTIKETTVYMYMSETSHAFSGYISEYGKDGKLLWTGVFGVMKGSKYAKDKGMSLLYQILGTESGDGWSFKDK